MLFDITLEGNQFALKIHRKFFENQNTPLSLFQADTPLTGEYSYLGVFQIEGETFGFDGCFKKFSEDENYLYYVFNFPEPTDQMAMRRMINTVYLSTYYVLESMYVGKEFFDTNIWDNQSLSFVVFNGGQNMSGYSIGGQLYPWFKSSLSELTNEDLKTLNTYVSSELDRVSNYFFNHKIEYGQVTIKSDMFFIQVRMNGRWLEWSKQRNIDRPEEFNSHNIDFRSDQEMCFTAIVALNTWLRLRKN